jgi:hypothetical protein
MSFYYALMSGVQDIQDPQVEFALSKLIGGFNPF